MSKKKLTTAEAILVSQEIIYETKYRSAELTDILYQPRFSVDSEKNKQLKEIAKKIKPEYHERYNKIISDFVDGIGNLVNDLILETVQD